MFFLLFCTIQYLFFISRLGNIHLKLWQCVGVVLIGVSKLYTNNSFLLINRYIHGVSSLDVNLLMF